MKLSRLAILGVLAASTGCDTDPGKGKTHAVVSAPVSASPAAAVPAPLSASAAAPVTGTALYRIDDKNSKIEFVGAKVTRKHPGSFGGFRGTILLEDGDPAKGRVKLEIDMPTLSVDEPKLTGHLKTADFFDVDRFPRTTFVSSSVQAAAGAYSVTGNLNLHGISKSITFPAAIKVSGGFVDAYSEFAINRKDFGIVYPGAPDDLIKDDVLIKFLVHANKVDS
jgi:polyisoprenoid-binding protein YceI